MGLGFRDSSSGLTFMDWGLGFGIWSKGSERFRVPT